MFGGEHRPPRTETPRERRTNMEYRNMRITKDYRDCVMGKEWQSLISSLSEILKSVIC